MENDLRYGKVKESVRADLENYSAWVSSVPSFGYNFCVYVKQIEILLKS